MNQVPEPIPNTFDEENPRDPYWFKRAVFYEVLIRGFADSNGDGTGDIRGLIERLDYLQWLGVDCLWLLPLYESPLRDGGYDISDYMKILPDFGDLGDFVQLIESAHRRGLRIVTDLVMNHTSDKRAGLPRRPGGRTVPDDRRLGDGQGDRQEIDDQPMVIAEAGEPVLLSTDCPIVI